VEIYALPPLTDQDRSEVKAMAINAPADTGAAIDTALARLAASKSKAAAKGEVEAIAPAASTAESASPSSAAPSPTVTSSVAAPANDSSASQPSQLGDVPEETKPGEPRKPPTLYGPDEKPEQTQKNK
jgi:hypothetical protein